MFKQIIGKHLRRRTERSSFEGAAWSGLPSDYADGPRELKCERRRYVREVHDFPSSAPLGYLR